MYDPAMYMPYYMGEFDKDGEMKPYFDVTVDNQKVQAMDPFLYWLIPIARYPKEPPKVEVPSHFRVIVPPTPPKPGPEDSVLKNFLKVHAGDEDGEK